MKINDIKIVNEGFFGDLANAPTSFRSYNNSDDRKNAFISKQGDLFKTDFIKDIYADLESALQNKAISAEPASATLFTQGTQPTQSQSVQGAQPVQPQPRQAIQPTAQSRQDALDRAAARKKAAKDKSRRKTKKSAPAKQTASTEDPGKDWEDMASGYNEDIYSRLNSLIESVIAEQSADEPESMSNYIVRWFGAYMQGINWKSKQTEVEKLAKSIEATYKKDKGKEGINNLANLAWSITYSSQDVPDGAKNIVSGRSIRDRVTDRDIDELIKKAATDPEAKKQLKALLLGK